jgi:hypothetical protein
MRSIGDAFNRLFEGKIVKALEQSANRIANDAKRNADNQGLPSIVANSIEVGEIENLGDGSYSISIVVDIDEKTGAPMAPAYEYGSGERGPEGQDYPITPRPGTPALAFLWKYPSPLGRKVKPYDEAVVFQKVMHPGVEARPFLQPAIDANKVKIGGIFAPLLKQAFRDAEPRVVFIKSDK